MANASTEFLTPSEPTQRLASVAAVVLTFNEEQDIAQCLQSLAWCSQIFLIDSGSTDRTVEIAEQSGAIVVRNSFTGFGDQRNFALDQLRFSSDWVLFLDADEVATLEFRSDLLRSISNAPPDVAGFYCCWKMFLNGRWLKRCDSFPKWQFRVVRKGRARFVNAGHGQKESLIDGRIDYIRTPYNHFAFSKGWTHWIHRHNRYSSEEALVRLNRTAPFRNVFSPNPSVRNTALKFWLTRLPGWPMLRFFHAYFIKRGILEGVDGFTYCVNMAYYEFLIKLKMRELRFKATAEAAGPATDHRLDP